MVERFCDRNPSEYTWFDELFKEHDLMMSMDPYEYINLDRPINRLPPDLLEEIFIKTVEDQAFRYPCKAPQQDFGDPTILSRVSHQWRNVAHSLPQLWSSIRIDCPSQVDITALRLWPERARYLPLKLSLHDDGEHNAATALILCNLGEHKRNWKEIALTIGIADGDHYAIYPAFRTIAENIATFEKLAFACIDLFQVRRTNSSSNTISATDTRSLRMLHRLTLGSVWKAVYSAPTLRSLRWGSGCTHISFDTLIPIRQQLTKIEFSCRVSARDLIRVIKAFPILESLVASRLDSPLPGCPITPVPFVCRALTDLSVSTWLDMEPFLQSFAAPFLKKLSMKFYDPVAPSKPEAVEEFLSRSNCCLEEFSIDGIHSEDEYLRFFFLPSLQRIRTLRTWADTTEVAIQGLTVRDANCPPLFPHLREIVLQVKDSLKKQQTIFWLMASRQEGGKPSSSTTSDAKTYIAPLRKVQVIIRDPSNRSFHKQWVEFYRRRMDRSIYTSKTTFKNETIIEFVLVSAAPTPYRWM